MITALLIFLFVALVFWFVLRRDDPMDNDVQVKREPYRSPNNTFTLPYKPEHSKYYRGNNET